ncbi:uncharacterized protein LOC127764593 [Oryza glaberrima]|uniref:DUF6598 domain-containing protein n=2 Tax=Oryza TaxID=4527 RepID=A0A0D3EX47_9ORYZ|nr:uncharacterized protein LOC127764593 [Oryza glaberrima]
MEKEVEEEEEEEEEAEASRKKGERGLGEGECGAPSSKKRDPELELRMEQKAAEWHRKARETLKEIAKEMAKYPNEDWSDTLGVKAREYREDWEYRWSAIFGPYDTISPIPPMRYTHRKDDPMPRHISVRHTLQIISVKIKGIRGGLQWPINVFGLIAARDTIDRNRIMIFNHTRDNCQTITKEDRYLLLTGPTRAVVVSDPVYFEAPLKVKGSVESEDKDLSFLAVPLTGASDRGETRLVNREYTSRLSTLELTFGFVVESLEASISVSIIDGSWQDGFRGAFTAHTPSLKDNKVLLLDSGYCEMVPVTADRMIKLSRHVVSVEGEGDLTVSVLALGTDNVIEDEKDFTPKEAGMSQSSLDVGFCKLEAIVNWSLLSLLPDGYT